MKDKNWEQMERRKLQVKTSRTSKKEGKIGRLNLSQKSQTQEGRLGPAEGRIKNSAPTEDRSIKATIPTIHMTGPTSTLAE